MEYSRSLKLDLKNEGSQKKYVPSASGIHHWFTIGAAGMTTSTIDKIMMRPA
jgi:hypothetical protein